MLFIRLCNHYALYYFVKSSFSLAPWEYTDILSFIRECKYVIGEIIRHRLFYKAS